MLLFDYRQGIIRGDKSSDCAFATFNKTWRFSATALLFLGTGLLPEKLGEVRDPRTETLILFQTKICDFPYPILDLTKNLIPYLRPIFIFSDLFQPLQGWLNNLRRALLMSYRIMMKKKLLLKTYPIQDCWVSKPYPILDQNGQNRYLISDQNG